MFILFILFATAPPPARADARHALEIIQLAAVAPLSPDAETTNRPDPVVRRIQKQLAKIGLYQGATDGKMGPNTEQAIRAFQKSRGLKVDGKATEALASTLESDEKVNQLLKRLETVRARRVDAAREALLADPRTRHLLDDEAREEVADPTRDPTRCFDEPSPNCLLNEAVESAKAIFKDELRDWALGEILGAQGRAGLAEDAMATVRRISDPRLVMVALRDIAQSLAKAGETKDAMVAADMIPDEERRLEAFLAIAGIQTSLSGRQRLDAIVTRIHALLKSRAAGERIKYFARFALMYGSLGDVRLSRRYLNEATTMAMALPSATARSAGLRHVAIARADMADPEGARALLDTLSTPSDRTPVLSSLALSLARGGHADEALKTAGMIEAGRYRAVALSHVATTLAHAGDAERAKAAIGEARFVADQIKLPYARAFAASRVAMALLDVATASGEAFNDAIEAADAIEDNTLRAYTLWAIATEQRRAGERQAAAYTETLAREAVSTIKSRLSQVWLYGDLSSSFAESREIEPAWTAFNDGLTIARGITNAWGRARALAKLSNALSVLTAPEGEKLAPGQVPVPDAPIPNGGKH